MLSFPTCSWRTAGRGDELMILMNSTFFSLVQGLCTFCVASCTSHWSPALHVYVSASYLICSPLCSCSTLVGHKAAGLCPVLPRCSDRFPHRCFAAPLSRVLLGVHRRGVFSAEAGEWSWRSLLPPPPSLKRSLFATPRMTRWNLTL